ncbi:MAG: hypothetical protein GXP44_01930, partial [bacterium]|nr:hypothetical protein [bacterium]
MKSIAKKIISFAKSRLRRGADRTERRKPTLLIILDGFGISPDKIGSPWEAA